MSSADEPTSHRQSRRSCEHNGGGSTREAAVQHVLNPLEHHVVFRQSRKRSAKWLARSRQESRIKAGRRNVGAGAEGFGRAEGEAVVGSWAASSGLGWLAELGAVVR